MPRTAAFILALLLALAVGACGQKGPLTLPDDEPETTGESRDDEQDRNEREEI